VSHRGHATRPASVGLLLGLTLCLASVLGGLGARPAVAATADDGWVIESFVATIDVAADGSLAVTEEIVVDFGALERHGIFRVIPVRYPLAAGAPVDLPEGRSPDEYLRRIDVSDIAVESSAPADLEIERPTRAGPTGTELQLRIGDEDTTVTGRQLYRISYAVDGALTDRSDLVELYWNATGHSWPVLIEEAQVLVRGPQPTDHTCFRGEVGQTSLCEDLSAVPEATRYTSFELEPGEGMTVVFAYAPEDVEVGPPLLVERFTLARAFTGSPLTVPVTALTSVLALGGVAALLYRQGRDRIRRGGTGVDGRVDPLRRPLLRQRASIPVQFRPPGELRPAQLGLVVDERVEPLEITATIVDLAVRGHLVITEESEDRALWSSRTDWRLTRQPQPSDDRPSDDRPSDDRPSGDLLPYERHLLEALFRDSDEVRVSDLKGTFSSDYEEVRNMIYRDGSDHGWFANRPDKVRNRWLAVGIVVTLLAAGLLAAAVLFSTIALAFVPFVLAGVVLVVGHRAMPHRTVHGSEVLKRTLGFREFISTAETGRMEYAEEAQLFVAYLPYAVVFGAVDRWARAFANLGEAGAAAIGSWYVGTGMYDGFAMARMSSGLNEFSSTLSTSLPVVPASSGGSGFSAGGGFSGGGMGGGGGGSW